MACLVDRFGNLIPFGAEEYYLKSGKMSLSCEGDYLRMKERQKERKEPSLLNKNSSYESQAVHAFFEMQKSRKEVTESIPKRHPLLNTD